MIDETTLQELAQELANNHAKFECFAWHDEPADSERWAIIYTHHRDSGLLDQSNASVIEKELEPFAGRTVRFESHNHWAVGHVDGFAIKVYLRDGSISKAFRRYAELWQALEDHPILDESDYSELEYESAMEGIRQQGGYVARREDWILPDGWESAVWDWLWENEQRELENTDDTGAYPSEESMSRAFDALGYGREGMRRCESCGEWCTDHETIPGPYDDGFWESEASEHADDCEWARTRAYRAQD